jgi:hypothetical protein
MDSITQMLNGIVQSVIKNKGEPVMRELIDHCLYESGLTADGCWDELDDYAKKAIARFAKLLARDFYNDASMLELRLRNRIEELEQELSDQGQE